VVALVAEAFTGLVLLLSLARQQVVLVIAEVLGVSDLISLNGGLKILAAQAEAEALVA
jgi:hypothetical protein